MKKILSIIVLSIFCTVSASAQKLVSGIVKDIKGEPVIGAVVQLKKNPSVGVVTDVEGKYSIKVPNVGNDVLTVSCLGYHTQDVSLEGRVVLDIELKDDTEELEEVVVVGYGSMRRSDLTGSVSVVKVDESESEKSTSIDELLLGKAAGVQVMNNSAAPDAGVSIQVRGMSSFNTTNEPLYVVDGVIINVNTNANSLISKGEDNSDSDEATNGLMGINPQDIASMEILKDASATAIYGAEGANGVVIITTKEAVKERPSITFGSSVTVSRKYKRMEMLDFDEWCDYAEAMGSTLSNVFTNPAERTGLKVTPIDWQDYMMRTAISQNYYLSISGKPSKTSYRFSMGYKSRQGIVRNTDVDQLTVRLNLDRWLTRHVKFGTKTNLAYYTSNLTQGANAGRITSATSIMRSMLSYKPYTGLEAEDDENDEDDEDDEETTFKSSPEKWLTEFTNKREEIRVTPSVYLQYNISKWIHFKSTFGADYIRSERTKFKSMNINSTSTGSNGAIGNYETVNYNWDNLLTYNRKFNKHHSVNATLGHSLASKSSSSQTIQGWNILQYKMGTDNLNSSPNTAFSYSESQSATLSFFGRAIYNYSDRYVFTATYRFDGSSKFKAENKWAQFPSFALAWRVNQEKWFKADAISMLKVRLGWGRVGNQRLSNYMTLSNYSSSSYPDHTVTNTGELIKGLYASNIANENLKWETTEQVNGGIDFGMFGGRLTLSADAYYKTTYDLLQRKTIPMNSGYKNMWVNSGTITNKGIELTLEATPVKAGSFEWSLNGNFSINRNSIVELGPEGEEGDIYITPGNLQRVNYFYGSSLGSGTYGCYPLNVFIQGQPMGLFYGLVYDGIVQEGETGLPIGETGTPRTPGSIKYRDLNNNGYIDLEDRTIIGNPNAKFHYGFGSSIRWRNLMATITFNGMYGRDVYNLNYLIECYTSSSSKNIYRDAFYKAWTPENPNTEYAGIMKMTSDDVRYITSRGVEDASYLRLANVSLSYGIPMPKNSKVLKRITLSASAGNLYVWTKYRGWDPSVNSHGTSVQRMGVDVGSYPSARSYTFGVNFTF